MLEPVRFSDLPIHASLQRALATRGYETATPVQSAVLDPAAAGRDLVVSSQTGSGKTIAFGAALADTLLAPVEGTPPARTSGAPRALVIVPTRELVAQVREELGWLLAGTSLRLASFTGGTAVGGDLRALNRPVDIAVGTPGRLVDLLRREKLKLGQIEVVVLDEADEMLDLGFREDLETLLGASPVARRTLMLSATLPPEIRALARRFQRDALAIDPRKGGADGAAGGRSGPGAHDDITYVAHLIAGGDRLAAVVNLLRASEDSRAIVFCTTRDGVGSLHRELMARGFAATAISGERAQAERDRALDQVRQGEARILVATNVAARGLHLPDVDLIIHADLPLNAESLTHRSGRTGRAGRKGTAVVIASLAERRKAERLLSSAQVRVAWTTPPSGKQIAAAARARLIETLLAEAGQSEPEEAMGETTGDDGQPAPRPESARADHGGGNGVAAANANAAAATDDDDDLLAPFRGKLSSDDLARRLLARELDHLPTGEPLLPVHLPSAGDDRRFGAAGGASAPSRSRGPGEMSRNGVMFRVNLGVKDQADPRWLLPLICRRGGVTRREVGAIRIGPQETVFEIAGEAARDFALAASQTDPRAPQVRMEPIDGGGGGGGDTQNHGRAHARPAPRSEGPRTRSFDGPPRPAARSEGPRARSFDAPTRPAPRSETPAAASFDAPPRPAARVEEPAARSFDAPPRPAAHVEEPAAPSFDAPPRPAARSEGPRARSYDGPPRSPPSIETRSSSRLPPHDRPHQRRPFGQTPAGDGPSSPAAKPFAAKPFAGKAHPAAKPFVAKAHPAAKPHHAPKAHHGAKPLHAKPHYAKPSGPKADHPRPSGGKRKA